MTTDRAAHHVIGSPLHQLLIRRTPRVIVTPALIVANVLIYAAVAGVSDQYDPDPGVLIRFGALFGPGVANGEWWRLVSAIFLHVSLLHVAFNCVLLRQIGSVAERLLGPFAFLTVYLVTGVTGSIASLMTRPGAVGVGASGALLGIVGVLLAVVLFAGGQMRELLDDSPISVGLDSAVAELRPRAHQALGDGMLIDMRELRVRLLMFLLFSVQFALLTDGFDFAAHAGGLAGGLAVGRLIGRDAITRRPPLVRQVAPILLTIALAALQVERTRAHADVLSESLAFGSLDERHLTQFDAVRKDVSDGRTRRDAAAVLVERSVLPDIQGARDRCEALRRMAFDNLTRAESLDRFGRASDWQHLEQYRVELARAEAWAAFLKVHQESWQLRVRSLRENDTALADQATQIDRTAMKALLAVVQSTSP